MRENFGNTIENLVASQLKIKEDSAAKTVDGDPEHLCLVATKLLSFGVGGGVSGLLPAHETTKAPVEMVLEQKGVGRKVMRVWSTSSKCIEIYPGSRTQVNRTLN